MKILNVSSPNIEQRNFQSHALKEFSNEALTKGKIEQGCDVNIHGSCLFMFYGWWKRFYNQKFCGFIA
jgi:hypothetical protein